jgi:hypothetical protein
MVRGLLGWLNLLNDLGLEQGAVPCYEDNSAAHSLITSDYVVRGAYGAGAASPGCYRHAAMLH